MNGNGNTEFSPPRKISRKEGFSTSDELFCESPISDINCILKISLNPNVQHSLLHAFIFIYADIYKYTKINNKCTRDLFENRPALYFCN